MIWVGVDGNAANSVPTVCTSGRSWRAEAGQSRQRGRLFSRFQRIFVHLQPANYREMSYLATMTAVRQDRDATNLADYLLRQAPRPDPRTAIRLTIQR